MSDERKRENEEEKLKDFFHNVIGIKSEAVLEVLAENSVVYCYPDKLLAKPPQI